MSENYLNFHDTVLIVSCVECAMLAAVAKLTPGRLPQTRNLLSLFFIVMAVALGSNMALWKAEVPVLSTGGVSLALLLIVSASLIKGPLLYFYLHSLYQQVHQSPIRLPIYFAPTVLAVVAIFAFNISANDWVGSRQLISLKDYIVLTLWLMIKIIPVIFVIKIALLLIRHAKINTSPDIEHSGEAAFAKVVFYCFGAHWLWLLITYIASFTLHPNTSVILGITGNYLMFILLKVIFVMGAVAVLGKNKINKKNETPKISDPENKIHKIEDAILKHKLHLDKTINLDRFSQRIDLSVREVSLLIHTHYKSNFVDFINSHRIEEAKSHLSNPAQSKESIRSIASRSGFNSISSFNRVFAKQANMTPTEYRERSSE